MKLSQKNQKKFLQYRTYSHHEHDLDDFEEDFWSIMAILFTILAVWTGAVHLIDYWTFDAIPWWAEPLTIIPIIFLIVMTILSQCTFLYNFLQNLLYLMFQHVSYSLLDVVKHHHLH